MADAKKPGIWAQKRLHPATRAPEPCTKLLSILDATTARFTPTGALWLYDATSTRDARDPSLFDSLEESLKLVLSSYQHWAGRLRWATAADVPASHRHAGRIVVDWGSTEDPGVDLALAYSDRRLEDFVPSQASRRSDQGIWDATSFPQAELLNPERLALSDLKDVEKLVAATVQLTAFACGGYSIAVHVAHPLADAQALGVFVQRWAAHTQAMQGQKELLEKLRAPLFEPKFLDRLAAPVSSGSALEEKTKVSRALPLHRFDWWGIEDEGYPEWALETTKTNMAMLPADSQPLTPAVPAPWPTWDAAAPVRHVFFHFSTAHSIKLRSMGRSGRNGNHGAQRLDGVLAQVWSQIIAARHPKLETAPNEELEETAHLNYTLGARMRVRPPLPESFVGSPIFLMDVACPLLQFKKTPLRKASRIGRLTHRICSNLDLFTPAAMNDMLHDAAHEELPQRLWGAFLGRGHVLVTSWRRVGVYRVDFWGDGQAPRLVRAVMPPCDGLVQIMDADDSGGDMDVGLCLEAGAMERLLQAGAMYDFETPDEPRPG